MNILNPLKEISQDEISNYSSVGSATAISLGHAVFMGMKHVKDFSERVVAYSCDVNALSEIFEKSQADMNIDSLPYKSYTFYENN